MVLTNGRVAPVFSSIDMSIPFNLKSTKISGVYGIVNKVPVHTVHQERRTPKRRIPNQPVAKPQVLECYRCGGKHRATECKFCETECLVCKKKGHIARACRSKQKSQIRTHQFLTSATQYG